ncbi:Flp family type IVb pilin [Knoellia sp. CPCC 206453]|uniref:Flp family type IVb pilin n=1 Tax=Knoellia pratensis TaxID=3404796 RepID=UPI00360BD9B0
MSKALVKFHQRLVAEKGATMVEYGLMVALVAVVVAVAATVLGTNISTMFNGLKFP